MRLSLCISLYNEVGHIPLVIDSTIDWVDEIVIVDGGSTDGTLEALRSRGPKISIISVKNDPMFHRMKQKAIESAQGDWVLQLDADEEITAELRDEILSTISAQNEDVIAYQIPRKNLFLGRFLMKGGVYPDYTIRLYRRGTMYFPCKSLHENVEPTAEARSHLIEGKWLGQLKHPMNHYSDPNWARYINRWHRYCKAEAVILKKKSDEMNTSSLQKYISHILLLMKYILVYPGYTFLNTYIRHKGCMDGWQGFVFHFMSALRWWGIVYYCLRP
ncbi:MAG: glycosyltransferase family 2 protein [Candidatus Roizmanbacteria bacterium]